MYTTPQMIGFIGVMAAVTLLTRASAFLLFPPHKPTPPFVAYLGTVLPFAVIGMLVVFCLKNITPLAYPYGLPELLACAVVAALHIWRHSSLLSIGVGTAFYMLLVQVVFV